MQASKQLIASNLQKLGLDATQTKLLTQFCRRLGSDVLSVLYDRQTVEVFTEYALPYFSVKGTLDYLRDIDYQQSIKEYSKIQTQIEKFCEPNHPKLACPELDQVLAELRRDFESLRVEPLVYSDDASVLKPFKTLQPHAGWLWVMDGKDMQHTKKADFADGIYRRYEEELNRGLKDKTFGYITMPGVRTQNHRILEDDGSQLQSKTEGKTRTILMVCFIHIILENKYHDPLVEQMHACDTFNWWASGKSDRQVRAMVSKYKRAYKYWMSIDYSSYDATISDWLLRYSYGLCELAYGSSSGFNKAEWDLMVHDSICKRIIDANGQTHMSFKGNGSGLKFTALNASLCNAIAAKTTLAILKITDYRLLIVGDDLLVFWNPNPGDFRLPEEVVSQYSKSISRNFGLVVHPHKCNWIGRYKSKYSKAFPIEQPTFLSAEWYDNGKYRNPVILMGKAAYPERFRDHHIVTPEVVFYSYVLAYPLGMRDAFDVDRFLKEHPKIDSSFRRAVEQDWKFGRQFMDDMFGFPELTFEELHAA